MASVASLLRDAGPGAGVDGTGVDELRARAGGYAALLAGRGVEPGDAVALRLPNGPALVAAYHGVLSLGAVAVPLGAALREVEVERRVEHAGARVLLTADDRPQDGAIEVVEPGKLAVLLYTSGTTGTPRAAELTHAGLLANARSIGRSVLRLTAGDVVYCGIPLAHVFGQSAGMNAALDAGARLVVGGRFEPEAVLDLLAAEGVTVFLGVPTMCVALLGAAAGRAEVPRLRLAHVGGAPSTGDTLARFAERFGCEVAEGYGMTEASGLIAAGGRPVDGTELRIAGDGPGEVLVRGPGVMRGYHRDPEATAAALSNGWLATGDVGTFEADGRLRLVDRLKDVILRGGYSVYPSEVEDVLHAHPAVREAVVLGVPDPLLGEEVVALVVPDGTFDAAALQAFVRERVAGYKYPRLVAAVDELPRSPTGKVLRRAIDRAPLRRALDD
jgi:long-chain acyl-CoA synthetase